MSDEARFLVSDRFYVDCLDETLVVDGSSVPLHQRAYQVLLALMARPNALVTKRELFEEVWGTLAVSDAVLTTAIKELRQALGRRAALRRFFPGRRPGMVRQRSCGGEQNLARPGSRSVFSRRF